MKKIEPLVKQEGKETGAIWSTFASGWRLDKDNKPLTPTYGKTGPVHPPETMSQGTGAITIFQTGVSKQTGLAQLGERFGLGHDGTGYMNLEASGVTSHFPCGVA